MSVEIIAQRPPTYNRKTWNLVAKSVHDAIPTQLDRERLCRLFADLFEKDSPYFRREKFRRIMCGYDQPISKVEYHRKGGTKGEESFD